MFKSFSYIFVWKIDSYYVHWNVIEKSKQDFCICDDLFCQGQRQRLRAKHLGFRVGFG